MVAPPRRAAMSGPRRARGCYSVRGEGRRRQDGVRRKTMDFTKFQTVKVEIAQEVAWVTMTRPAKRNAMSPQMHEEMIAALRELAEAPQAKVLVLTGAAESWSAGQ